MNGAFKDRKLYHNLWTVSGKHTTNVRKILMQKRRVKTVVSPLYTLIMQPIRLISLFRNCNRKREFRAAKLSKRKITFF